MVRRKSPIKEESIEYSAKRAQNLYLTKQYELLLPRAERLRQMAQDPQYDAIVLTSYIWSVRAMQALHHPQLAKTIEAYIEAAQKRQHPQHLLQAAQFKLDHALSRSDYERAIDALKSILLALGDSEQTFPLLYQIAELEIACTYFDAAHNHLDVILNSEHAPAGIRVMAKRLMYNIYDMTGKPDLAQFYLDSYLNALVANQDDEDEQAEACIIRAELSVRVGQLSEALAARRELDEQYAVRFPEEHEKRRLNAISLYELMYYKGDTQQALDSLKILSNELITEDPNQTSHICRTLALSRCMLSLDVLHDVLSPELCKTRLKTVNVPPLPIEKISETLFYIQYEMYRKNYEGLSEKLDDLRHSCMFMGLKACLAPIDATQAELCSELGDLENAKLFAQSAMNGFSQRHDEVSLARVEARLLQIDPKDLDLETQLLEKADAFLSFGHQEIVLTIYLAVAQAHIRRQDKEGAKDFLAKAAPLLRSGYMGAKENKYKTLCEEADMKE